jgi:hypothetical protein
MEVQTGPVAVSVPPSPAQAPAKYRFIISTHGSVWWDPAFECTQCEDGEDNNFDPNADPWLFPNCEECLNNQVPTPGDYVDVGVGYASYFSATPTLYAEPSENWTQRIEQKVFTLAAHDLAYTFAMTFMSDENMPSGQTFRAWLSAKTTHPYWVIGAGTIKAYRASWLSVAMIEVQA